MRARDAAERLPWRSLATPRGFAFSVLGAGIILGAASGLFVELLRNSGPLRGLPGVEALIPIDAPTYERSIFGLRSPLSVGATADGEFIYVAEGSGDRTVRKIRAADGEIIADLAPPRTEAGTRKPISVAVSPDGHVYVVDRVRHAVDVYNAADQWIGTLPQPDEGPWQPLSVDVDYEGRAYVTNTDPRVPVLLVYDASRHLAEEYASIDAEGLPLSFPNGVARGRDGRLIIDDSNNARLVLFDTATRATTVFGNRPNESLALPRGVVVDSRGLALVVDANDHAVLGWDFSRKSENQVFMFGEPGIGEGAFLFPNDIAVAARNHIFVADRDNDRVQIWRY
jgi:DNA-binding beta-propeller fold protein YncE